MSAIWSASSSTVISIVVERAFAALDQVAEPAGRGDQDVDAAAQVTDLLVVRASPPNAVRLNRPSVRASGVIASLTCMASSRVGTRTSAFGRPGRGLAAVRDAYQQRQAERERLAGAGLAPAEHVPPGQRVRDRRGLDRERRGDLLLAQRAHELGRNA